MIQKGVTGFRKHTNSIEMTNAAKYKSVCEIASATVVNYVNYGATKPMQNNLHTHYSTV